MDPNEKVMGNSQGGRQPDGSADVLQISHKHGDAAAEDAQVLDNTTVDGQGAAGSSSDLGAGSAADSSSDLGAGGAADSAAGSGQVTQEPMGAVRESGATIQDSKMAAQDVPVVGAQGAPVQVDNPFMTPPAPATDFGARDGAASPVVAAPAVGAGSSAMGAGAAPEVSTGVPFASAGDAPATTFGGAQSPVSAQPMPAPAQPDFFGHPVIPAAPITPTPSMVEPAIGSGVGGVAAGGRKIKRSTIFLILGVVVILILAVVLLVVSSMRSSSSPTVAFNRYANYLLYGEEKTDALEGEYNATTYYKIDSVIDSAASDNQFVADLTNFWNDFAQQVQQNMNTETLSIISDNTVYIDFLGFYNNNRLLSEEELIKAYNKYGEDTIRQLSNTLQSDSSELADEYITLTLAYYNALMLVISQDKQAECLTETTIDQACVNTLYNSNATFQQSINNATESLSAVNAFTVNISKNLKSNCWQLDAKELDI